MKIAGFPLTAASTAAIIPTVHTEKQTMKTFPDFQDSYILQKKDEFEKYLDNLTEEDLMIKYQEYLDSLCQNLENGSKKAPKALCDVMQAIQRRYAEIHKDLPEEERVSPLFEHIRIIHRVAEAEDYNVITEVSDGFGGGWTVLPKTLVLYTNYNGGDNDVAFLYFELNESDYDPDNGLYSTKSKSVTFNERSPWYCDDVHISMSNRKEL